MSSLLHDVYFHSQLDSQIHVTTVLRPQFAGSGEPAIKQITLYYWQHNDIAIYRSTMVHFILFYFFCSTACFPCSQIYWINEPTWPAKLTRQADPPKCLAVETRQIHTRMWPAKITSQRSPLPCSRFPRQDTTHQPPPLPPTAPSAERGRGWGADPARLRILYRYFCFPLNVYIFSQDITYTHSI